MQKFSNVARICKSFYKNHTYVKKVGHTSLFLFCIYWWTWKTNIYWKNWWSWPIKNQIILVLTMLHFFFFKLKKNTRRYYYFTPVYQKSWWYDLQFLRYRAWQSEASNFGSFYPLKNHKNQKFSKNKKIPRDIIILHMCTKNHNHMVYSSWGAEWDRQNFLLFWATFCPFTHLMIPKIKIFKKWKNAWRHYPLHICTINQYMIYMVPEIYGTTHISFYHFGPFFALSPPWQPRKSKCWKIEKNTHMMHGS